jgi:hypothetical protein
MAGIALGAIIGIGSGLVFAIGKPGTSSAAAPSAIVVEAITPQPVMLLPAPEPKAAPVEPPAASVALAVSAKVERAAVPNAPASAAPPTALPGTPKASTSTSKPNPVAANDKMQQRLLWLEEDLKTKPAAKPATNPVPKSPPKPISVGSGLAF